MATTTKPEYELGQTLYVAWMMGMEVLPSKVGKVDEIEDDGNGSFVYHFYTPEGSQIVRQEDLLSKADVDNIG